MSPNSHQHIIDKFFVLDFDRTLGNTQALYTLFQEIIESVVDNDAMRSLDSARHEVEDQGRSFDSIHYVQKILAATGKSDRWSTIVDEFRTRAAQDKYLEPGTQRLLDYLNKHNYRYGIVTFGGQQWQELKIEAVGLGSIPAIVTDMQAKGRLIGSWRQSDGLFSIPSELATDGMSVTASSIVLIDDNPLNFEDLPDGVTGYYIQNESTRNREYGLPLSPQVYEVESLDEVIKMLDHVIDKT